MKILIYSSAFYPNIGGLEAIMIGLANGFVKNGHSVTVITRSAAEKTDDNLLQFKILRKPSFWAFLNELRKCDIYLEANVSLKTLIYGLLVKNRWVITHQGIYKSKGSGWHGIIKNYATILPKKNIAASNYVSENILGKSVVIPNFYDSTMFKNLNFAREKDIVFIGRLISDKGAHLLIQAMYEIVKKRPDTSLTIIGDGPARKHLQEMAAKNELLNNITFEGILRGKEITDCLNKHKIMVVPSIWEEPFGIVALEGLACGCRVLVSDRGGLPEALGECGKVFNPFIPEQLIFSLENELAGNFNETEPGKIELHLQKHTVEYATLKYIEEIQSILM